MFKRDYGFDQYVCLSTDTKVLAGIEDGAKLLVVDTQEQFLFNGSAWVEDTTQGGGGSGGVTVHNELTGRTASACHTIDAITDLSTQISSILSSIGTVSTQASAALTTANNAISAVGTLATTVSANATSIAEIKSNWYSVSGFSRVSDTSFTVTDNETNQAIFALGRPIRYRAAAGTYYYGIVTGYSSGTVTLAGVAFTSTVAVEMQYADFSRVVQVDLFIPGTCSTASSSTLLASFAKTSICWGLGVAKCVKFGIKAVTIDTGATQPKFNLLVNGSAVSSSNSNAGIAIATTWTFTTSDITSANITIANGNAIELSTDASGTNDTTANVTCTAIFVLV